jgi:Ni/Fe-hydrogenase subunit HybB-like protein
MPIIFICSAIVSGIALCVLLYMVMTWVRRSPLDDDCLDTIGRFLFLALVVDFAVEALDWVHRLYEAEESIHVLKTLASGKLFYTLLVVQACLGTLVPFLLLGPVQLFRRRIPAEFRRRIYFASSVLILIGVLAMRWNVVVGGQLFSKSLRGFTTFKLQVAGHEGWLMSLVLLLLPFGILALLVNWFLPTKYIAPNGRHLAEVPVQKPAGSS